MMRSLFGFCLHRKLSFPQTPVVRSRFGIRAIGAITVGCLDCGKRFKYDWQQMRIGGEVKEGSVPREEIDRMRGVRL